MNCPVCKTSELRMTDRSGVEIDYCPQCRGVWLDRGELDKIIERAAAYEQPGAPAQAPGMTPQAPPPPPQQPQPQVPPPGSAYDQPPPQYGQPYGQPGYRKKDDSDYKFRYPGSGHGHYPHRRKSFLGELFDFD